MRKTITYTLLILVLIGFNYKTINHYFKLSDNSISFIQDYECEEKNSESQKSNEKEEKKNFSEYLFSDKVHSLIADDQLLDTQHSKLLYITSDYSLAVYSPPRQAIV